MKTELNLGRARAGPGREMLGRTGKQSRRPWAASGAEEEIKVAPASVTWTA